MPLRDSPSCIPLSICCELNAGPTSHHLNTCKLNSISFDRWGCFQCAFSARSSQLFFMKWSAKLPDLISLNSINEYMHFSPLSFIFNFSNPVYLWVIPFITANIFLPSPASSSFFATSITDYMGVLDIFWRRVRSSFKRMRHFFQDHKKTKERTELRIILLLYDLTLFSHQGEKVAKPFSKAQNSPLNGLLYMDKPYQGL